MSSRTTKTTRPGLRSAGFEDNVLLKVSPGLVREGPLGDRASDRFLEDTEVGLISF